MRPLCSLVPRATISWSFCRWDLKMPSFCLSTTSFSFLTTLAVSGFL
uniref:Uncharacterized protein n=1 Tax=Arundo donax TaxID=35708 RepID=A0A0A9BJN6_ARUDO